jgi:hypothetical protein
MPLAVINLEQVSLRVPELAFMRSPNPSEFQLAARVADAVQDAGGFGGEFFAQALFEIGGAAAWRRSVLMSFRLAAVFRVARARKCRRSIRGSATGPDFGVLRIFLPLTLKCFACYSHSPPNDRGFDLVNAERQWP